MALLPGQESKQYWEGKWDRGEIGWHRDKVDERLKKYLRDLTGGRAGVRILVTWCGKSVDIPWLCSEGFDVTGVELSELAVKQMFEESGMSHSVTTHGDFLLYKATEMSLNVYVGNFYKLAPEVAGTFEAVWDHHALGASEPKDRLVYKSVLLSLLNPSGRILLSNFEYGEQKRDQAPFSISKEMIKQLFEDKFDIKFLENAAEFTDLAKSIFSFDWVNHHIHLLSLK